MAGLSKYARDKLAAELQSGTITSGPATITLGDTPHVFKLDEGPHAFRMADFAWPTDGAPCEGIIVDQETGQAWRIRFNQDNKRWEVDPNPIEGNIMRYVAWDYEEGADPPYYHIYSTDDLEPDALDLEVSLTINIPQSAQMDALIIAACEALEAAITHAAQLVSEE